MVNLLQTQLVSRVPPRLGVRALEVRFREDEKETNLSFISDQ